MNDIMRMGVTSYRHNYLIRKKQFVDTPKWLGQNTTGYSYTQQLAMTNIMFV